ncbi:uncharacterized protein HMPREF1120_02122 [Exophiala dermatitidis NIH/UT8656]|uniref:C2H2-type domain-containing protein n=1 Tax=Exophiala dermatitidis (strain ATCC 34100 / CBS 525.76 / NIH/UT8656) TaxID=858893 RepID=H6BR82_EXODN|nr:uncharacterized protein HMPREF1120_02122 [Exophiala dermatitidis NIH/UT8656]EHY53942.1 hypothetical protein HMPREF1120_02122 [Exophiala dermatitidis NIH/UT8656]
MAGAPAQPSHWPPCQLRTVRSNASIVLSHAGGATVVDTAHPTLSDAAENQAILSALSPPDRTPTTSLPPTHCNPSSAADQLESLASGDSFQGGHQYSSLYPVSEFSYEDFADTLLDIEGVVGHTTSYPDPEGQSNAVWTHLPVAEGRTTPLPAGVELNDLERHRHQVDGARDLVPSAVSGQESFRDSAYDTGCGKSQHEVESVDDPAGEAMDHSTSIYPNPSIGDEHGQVGESSALSVPVAESTDTQTPLTPVCPECGYVSRTNSDIRKHRARHIREYECPHCVGKAFATKNDLDRHLKSVHRINNRNSKDYKCFAEGCSKAEKPWPRKDNFKQHLKKMHPDQDEDHLLELSEQWYEQQQQQQRQSQQQQSQQEQSQQHQSQQHQSQQHQSQQHQSQQHQSQQHQSTPEYPSNDPESTNMEMDTMPSSGSVASAMHSRDDYENNYVLHHSSYDTPAAPDNHMERSLSLDCRPLDPALGRPTMQHHRNAWPRHLHRRNVSNPISSSRLQAQPPYLLSHDDPIIPSVPPMQRTQSQSDYASYSNNFPQAFTSGSLMDYEPSNNNNPWAVAVPNDLAPAMSIPIRYTVENDQIRRIPGPHTVAVPTYERSAELDYPQDVQATPSDELSRGQEELLLNVGGSTGSTATNGPDLSLPPQQPFRLNVIPPEEQSHGTRRQLGEKLQVEIQSFLHNHNSNAEKDKAFSFSDDDILNVVRSGLQNLSSSRTGAPVGGDGNAGSPFSSLGRSPGLVPSVTDRAMGKKRRQTRKGVFRCHWEGCGKVTKRKSELKKHMARHDKPYGCTWDGCTKTFGSKNDWKRHEQSQHQHPECWYCPDCNKVFFYNAEVFMQHMREEHPTYLAQEDDGAGYFQIAANYQGQYWCGFCNDIIRQDEHGGQAVTARFNHIADHFKKENRSSKDWIELRGGGKTKGELHPPPQQRQQAFDSQDVSSAGGSGNMAESQASTSSASGVLSSSSSPSFLDDDDEDADADTDIDSSLSGFPTFSSPLIPATPLINHLTRTDRLGLPSWSGSRARTSLRRSGPEFNHLGGIDQDIDMGDLDSEPDLTLDLTEDNPTPTQGSSGGPLGPQPQQQQQPQPQGLSTVSEGHGGRQRRHGPPQYYGPAAIVTCCQCRSPSAIALGYTHCMDPSCAHELCGGCRRHPNPQDE